VNKQISWSFQKSFLIAITCLAPYFFSSLLVFAQPNIGEKVPGFITSTLEGDRISLKDYWEKQRKKVLVLSFFSTYCEPCKEDLKYLQNIQNKYGSKGLQVLGVLTQDPAEEPYVQKFMGGLGINFVVLFDELNIIGDRYGVILLPHHFVVDGKGIFRGSSFGLSVENRKDFENLLEGLLLICEVDKKWKKSQR